MRRTAALLLAALVLVPASAGASTGAARPPLALTVTPAHLSIAGSGRATVRVANPGWSPLVVEVGRAGFSLDLRGRPRIGAGGARAATSWLAVRPGRFVLAAGASRPLTVFSKLPARAEPGDHDALVLLTTRPRRSVGVAVRMRIGVVVVVRAPGRIVRRLVVVGGLRVRRSHGSRILELGVANRGNVTETLARERVRVTLLGRGMKATPAIEPRDVRPRTSGVVQFRYRGGARGWVTARVEIAPVEGGPTLRRSFRVKL